MTRKKKAEELLAGLNDVQRQAVQAPLGPVLVLAGAGSGKTRVLTHRIAYLISHYGVDPSQIMAVTFTNKAANEMKSRLSSLLKADFNQLWVGTFHSIFARILRSEGYRLGYPSNFVIYDSADQEQVIKEVMAKLDIPVKQFPPRAVHARISRAKNELISPAEYRKKAADDFEQKVAEVFTAYTGFLKANNAMDFDDLLVLPVELFRKYPSVLEQYQERFQHILVDEFQDTNRAQNELVRLLGKKYGYVFVVGDDDQSIYRWRGAEVRNILEFEKTFPGCRIYRLEQNYRSTKTILDAAHCVVRNNRHRREKRLWTDREEGEALVLIEAEDEADEARLVVNRIRHEISKNKRNFRDFVVLYRTNAQSRALEDALRRAGISYVIVGGIRFYERKEIKDFLAYLRVIANPSDEISLIRATQVPPRGIGPATLARLRTYAEEHGLTLLESFAQADKIPGIQSATRFNLLQLAELFAKYRKLRETLGLDELARVLNDEVGFLRMFKEEGTLEAMNRYDNVQELLSAISEFCQTRPEPTLEAFLEEVALVTDVDRWNDRSNAVTLMTLHSAKGLEFPVVFITGLEEGLFPLSRSRIDPYDFEEERRLFYVGLTRAKEKVYLSWARNRRRYTEGVTNQISSFVEEIDLRYLEQLVPRRTVRRRMAAEVEQFDPMPDYENESQLPGIYVGCSVRHPHFGNGVVTGMNGHGGNLKVTVLFEDGVERKLVYRMARLEILE